VTITKVARTGHGRQALGACAQTLRDLLGGLGTSGMADREPRRM
jgi:hypothetical protein